MNYSVKTLRDISQKKKTSDSFLEKTAEQALELIGASNKVKLDLTFETYKNMAYALVAIGMKELLSKSLEQEETRRDLITKAASYELFLLCNFINESEGFTCTLEMNLMISVNPILKAVCDADGSITYFDVFKAYEKSADKCFVFTGNPMAPIAVNLDFTHEIISNEFLNKI